MLALFLHTLSILFIQSLGLKLGYFKNTATSNKIEDIIERPPDENITAYSFIRQPFFHKSKAFNAYEKRKDKKRKCC